MVTEHSAVWHGNLGKVGLGRLRRILLGGFVLLGGSLAVAQGAPPVAKMLEYKPRHDIFVTTPAPAEHASCKVELLKGTGAGSSWVLKDSQGRLLRKFGSSDGRNVDTYSYYRDGVEVYREVLTPGARVADQFRWLNAGGSKFGVDEDKNGTIDTWKVISPEETSQEVLRALATRDVTRLEAVLITDQDIQALGLPAEAAESLRARRKTLKTKFDQTIAKLPKLTEKAVWLHLETGAPQCVPAEQTGAKFDLIRHSRGTVLFESGGANEWFQVGPMIQVGAAWKVIDAPTPGATFEEKTDGSGSRAMDIGSDPKLQKMIEELTALDKKTVPTNTADAVKHHLERADVLEKIVAAVKAQERDPWIRQVADSLSSAVQAGGTDNSATTRLASLEKQLVEHMAGSNLTAYVSFRRMQAEYSAKLSAPGKAKFEDIQKDWLEKLTGFVRTYPRAEDTADAMLQLGMVCEFLGKDVEAKNWYGSLAKTFADKSQGAKGAGAIRRLGLEGQPMQVAGPLLSDTSSVFDVGQLSGKVVIVYYWASWNGQAASDFGKLKAIASDSEKQVEILSVNLDGTVDEAKAFLAKNQAPGTHLHQPGGLESKLATQYGITVLPSVFLIGKDGKCVNKSAQISTLDDEVKKLLKK